jgi:hypothetical protein
MNDESRYVIARILGTHSFKRRFVKFCKLGAPCLIVTDRNGKESRQWENASSTQMGFDYPPNYFEDLNAINKAYRIMLEKEGDWFRSAYQRRLEEINPSDYWNATAAERAQAFLKVFDAGNIKTKN